MLKRICVVLIMIYSFAFGRINAKEVTSNGDQLVHHLIIAIDYSPNPKRWVYNDITKETIKKLSNYMIKDGAGCDRVILSEYDYYSVLAFRASVSEDNLNQYVKAIERDNEPLIFIKNNGKNTLGSRVDNEWNQLIGNNPWSDDLNSSFSLLSVAKPYCLNYFSTQSIRKDVNRTFLMVISDRIFNGDMYSEILNLADANFEDHDSEIKDYNVYPICYDVNQSYFTRHIDADSISFKSYNPSGYVDLYEFVPLQKNFQLNSVMDLPSVIKAKRIRGQKFLYELNVRELNNPSYKLIALQVENESGEIIGKYTETELGKGISITKQVSENDKSKWLKFVATVRIQDGVYNNTVMSPSMHAIAESGRDGLVTKIAIEYEEKANIFFMPMPDFMWLPYSDNQQVVAVVWEVIIVIISLVLLFLLLMYLYNKYQYYTPKIDEIKLIIKK